MQLFSNDFIVHLILTKFSLNMQSFDSEIHQEWTGYFMFDFVERHFDFGQFYINFL